MIVTGDVYDNGSILVSTDGVHWETVLSPKDSSINSVVWDGTKFLAIGIRFKTPAVSYTSQDGRSWTETTGKLGVNDIKLVIDNASAIIISLRW